MVEGAALEMLCGETHLGFESLTLRQIKEQIPLWCLFFFVADFQMGFEGRAAQSNSPVDCCDRERPSDRSRASRIPNSPPSRVFITDSSCEHSIFYFNYIFEQAVCLLFCLLRTVFYAGISFEIYSTATPCLVSAR